MDGIRSSRAAFAAALSAGAWCLFAARAKWLGFPLGWAYLTGAASIAGAAGMLFAVVPRLAASLEAAMLWIFTVLVWVPRVVAQPQVQGNWSEILISAAIASGAWLVADAYRGVA